MTLSKAVYLATSVTSSALHRAVAGLKGCPIGGWPETEQALRGVSDALPLRAERDFTINAFLEAVTRETPARRYRWATAEELQASRQRAVSR